MCAYAWMQSPSAQVATANVTLSVIRQQGTADNNLPNPGDEVTCHCPPGTFFQREAWYRNEYTARREFLLSLERCSLCPADTFSLGGYVVNGVLDCQPCENLPWGFYCLSGRKVECPSSPALACVLGKIVPALGVYCDPPQSTSCQLRGCSPGYYCPGDLMQAY
jgi:hypothetical protein